MNSADKVIPIANDLFAEASCAWGVYIMDSERCSPATVTH